MGMESVDTVLEVQERCGVVLDDAELIDIRTVGELHRLVLGLLPPTVGDSRLTHHVFLRLRAAHPGSERAGPGEIVPLGEGVRARRRAWKRLESECRLRLPGSGLLGPPDTTWGELAEAAASLNLGRLVRDPGVWSEADVWRSVRDSVAEVAGVDAATVTRSTRFVEDLGF